MSKRPYWQSEPCPPWCMGGHRKSHAGSDRRHSSKWGKNVALSLMDARRVEIQGRAYYDKPEIEVGVVQYVTDASPRVELSTGADEGIRTFQLSLDEARKLAKMLKTAVDIAEGRANPGGAS